MFVAVTSGGGRGDFVENRCKRAGDRTELDRFLPATVNVLLQRRTGDDAGWVGIERAIYCQQSSRRTH